MAERNKEKQAGKPTVVASQAPREVNCTERSGSPPEAIVPVANSMVSFKIFVINLNKTVGKTKVKRVNKKPFITSHFKAPSVKSRPNILTKKVNIDVSIVYLLKTIKKQINVVRPINIEPKVCNSSSYSHIVNSSSTDDPKTVNGQFNEQFDELVSNVAPLTN